MWPRFSSVFPDGLKGREINFDGIVVADVSEAEHALACLDAEAERLADTEALARTILRAESVASSEIEGLVVGARRLLKADLALRLGDVSADRLALEVLANTEAASFALTSIDVGQSIDVATLLEVRRRLLAPTRLGAHAGRLRDAQISFRRRRNSSNRCCKSFARLQIAMTCPPLLRRRSPTRSYRRSTRSSMETGAWAGRSFK